MEVLFTTQTAYTYEEYKRFNYAVMKVKRMLWLLAACVILFGLFIFFNFVLMPRHEQLFYFLTVLLACLILFAVILFAVILSAAVLISIKITYRSNKHMQNNVVATMHFYGDSLEEETPSGKVSVKYAELSKIIETKTNFYLMLAKNQGIIIVKQNCSPELIDFLQELKEQTKRRQNG